MGVWVLINAGWYKETCARVGLDGGFASFLAERERYGRDAVLGYGFDGQALQPVNVILPAGRY